MENQPNQTNVATEPLPTPTSFQSSPESPKQNYLKLLVIVLVLALLGMGGLVVYLLRKASTSPVPVQYTQVLQPSPTTVVDETTNWKTYTNSAVGYTIKYPSDWTVILKTPSTENAAQGDNTNTVTIAKDNYKLSVTTSSLGGGGIICDFDDSTKDEFHGPATDKLGAPYEIGTFLDKPARRNLNPITTLTQYGMLRQTLDYTYEACIPVESDLQHTDGKVGYTSTINANNLIVYNAYYTPRENINTENLKTMDQILSTFKFTDQSQVDTANWKEYSSNHLRIAFSYPSDVDFKVDNDENISIVGKNDIQWPWITLTYYNTSTYNPPAGIDLNSWVTSKFSHDDVGSVIAVAGVPTVHLVTKRSPQTFAFDEYYFLSSNKLIQVQILHHNDKQDADLYNSFLNSIKIL